MLRLLRPVSRARSIPSIQWTEIAKARRSGPQKSTAGWDEGVKRLFGSRSGGYQEAAASLEPTTAAGEYAALQRPQRLADARKLPVVCPGCGALSQTVDPHAAGYYNQNKGRIRAHVTGHKQAEDAVFQAVLQSGALKAIAPATLQSTPQNAIPSTPICHRCHHLLHHSTGTSILHPSISSIQSIIEASPHKHNHIYHVLDAADFPLSLIPNLPTTLHLPRLRTRNRRSRSDPQYLRGRTADMSFIITRSDLLAPRKEQVDSLIFYLREVLREALGSEGRGVRLGNVTCVSAKRGWRTREIKEGIWERGGGGWMVGKVNVGKSALVEVVFPKGRGQDVNLDRLRHEAGWIDGTRGLGSPAVSTSGEMAGAQLDSDTAAATEDGTILQDIETQPDGEAAFVDSSAELSEQHGTTAASAPQELPGNFQETDIAPNGEEMTSVNPAAEHSELHNQNAAAAVASTDSLLDIETDTFDPDDELLTDSLLPPLQKETPYPSMPLISALPGTTAAPIRLPFGGGKGELVDLPGIARSTLGTHVLDTHKPDLVMKSRVVPEQQTIRPRQSLLLGGLLRITPRTEDLIFLAYSFVPSALEPHVTSTTKAVAIQTGVYPETGEPYTGTVPSSATEAAKTQMKSAGAFKLEWDVTKRRSGPLTAPSAGKRKADSLPFAVYGADLLIEGVGWVELVAQVRRRSRSNQYPASGSSEDAFEEFERLPNEGPRVPEVEVFSPQGKFVGIRRPMNAWLLGGRQKVAAHARKGRPRMTASFMRRKAGGAQGG